MKNQIKKHFIQQTRNRERTYFVRAGHSYSMIFLVIAIIAGLLYCLLTAAPEPDMATLQSGIADKIVRFHVIANSDSEEDQALKLKVKEAVVAYTKPLLADSADISESRQLLLDNQEDIRTLAQQVITENGYDYPVHVELTNTYFPTKSYGSYTFPPGLYEAFEVKIGNAAGRNWWCVLYPPLCFIDISHGVVDEQSEDLLKETLTTEEFNAVSENAQVVYRFKYLKFLNKLF